MPVTIPNTYTVDTPVDANLISENYKAIRDWISGNTVLADFDADIVESRHIVRPEPIFLAGSGEADDWRFTSGPIYTNTISQEYDRSTIVTDHVKQANFDTLVQYQDIADVGKQIHLELGAYTIVTVYAWAIALANDIQDNDGNANWVRLFVDNDLVDDTLCYIADSNGSTTTGTPGHPGRKTPRVVPVVFHWSGQLTAGTHVFQVKCNPVLEYMTVNTRYIQVECLY